MKNFYSIKILNPCHENWNTMTPKEKGRFCYSCSKTVIDFTKMDSYKIQDFIDENKNNRICGHFKQSQLDSINIRIPSQSLTQPKSFHRAFLLALLIVMGTTLMNCTNKNGDKQKIDSVEVIDSINNEKSNVTFGLPLLEKSEDSTSQKTSSLNTKKPTFEEIMTDGELVIETVGDIEFIEKPSIDNDSLEIIDIPHCPSPSDEDFEDIILGFISVQTPPEFPNTPRNLSIQEKSDYFSKQVSKIVSENFNTSVCLNLKGKQKIFTQFKIGSLGYVKDIKAQAPHPKLEDEAIRVIKLLPQLIPAKQNGKTAEIVYNLPIIFEVEE